MMNSHFFASLITTGKNDNAIMQTKVHRESIRESLIVDGMDQNKTNLPHLVRVPKSCQNLWSLRTHLTGTLAHGIGNYGYFNFLQFPHDSNLTLTVLLHTLLSISKKGNLPRKLLIQMDNCVRENKNKYVMAFISFLFEMQVFVEVCTDCIYSHVDIKVALDGKEHTTRELHSNLSVMPIWKFLG